MTFASAFSGFGGCDIGAHRAGLTPIWGIEYEDEIAAVARANGLPTMTANVLEMDWSLLDTPYWFHTSPPCPAFSDANNDKGETENDIALAEANCDAIRTLLPPFVSIENVRGYAGPLGEPISDSLRRILATLTDCGYAITFKEATKSDSVLCAADYGIPQTRRRLIIVASRVAAPRLPVPTHCNGGGSVDLFGGALAPWMGWHEAIYDLLPDLPDAHLAPWQMRRLPDEWQTMLVAQGGYNDKVVTVDRESPAFAVTANGNQTSLKAVLVSSNTAGGDGVPLRYGDRPAVAVDTKAERIRAILLESKNSNQEFSNGRRQSERPAPTVTIYDRPSHRPVALMLDGKLNDHGRRMTTIDGGRPASTVTASPSAARDAKALMIQTGNTSDAQAAPGVGCLGSGLPANTVSTMRAASVGAVKTAPTVRTVRLSPRCLAVFQDFGRDYLIPGDGLPGTATLACRGIGNAVPPGLMAATISANVSR